MMTPVTAITIFLPMVDAQKLGARLFRGTAAIVLIDIFRCATLYYWCPRQQRQGWAVRRDLSDLTRELIYGMRCSRARKAFPRWFCAHLASSLISAMVRSSAGR